MYHVRHVIYTIVAISTTWYFNQSLLLEPALQSNPSGHGLRVPLSKRESDQIISVFDVTIVYIVYYVNWKPNGQGALVRWVYPVHTRDNVLNRPLAAEIRATR